MSNPDKMLALNELTGRVHDYTGPGLQGPLKCGCDGKDLELFREGIEHDTLTMINPKHLEAGVWEPAPCLQGDTE